jgi:hypothetical protein
MGIDLHLYGTVTVDSNNTGILNPSYSAIYDTNHTVSITTVLVYYVATDGYTVNTTNGPSYNSTTGGITIQSGGGGTYIVEFGGSATSGNNNLVHCSLFVDGTEDESLETQATMRATGTNSTHIGGSMIVDLAATEVVDMRCKKQTATNDIVFDHVRFLIRRIE